MAAVFPCFCKQRLFPGKSLFILDSFSHQLCGDLEVAFFVNSCVAAAMERFDGFAFKVSRRIDFPRLRTDECLEKYST